MEQNVAKILIVDDIPQNIQILGSILSHYDYQIAYAESGIVALKMLDQVSFDLVLLDIMMPEMDGFEVCRRMKSNKATMDIPVIFLTAKSDSGSLEQAFEIGGQDYVVKPFNIQELLSRVKTHIKLKQNNDAVRKQQVELEQVNDQLIKANTAKDKFFSIIAHDLKNPFSDLTSLSELLKQNIKKYDSDKVERFVNQIYKLSKRGYSLLENLLEWSRSQTGGIEWKPEIIHLQKIVLESIAFTENLAANKQIELINEVRESTKVYADANMLRTVLRNLITNAIKFNSPQGSVKIADTTFDIGDELSTATKMIQISVQDTGIGLEQVDLDKLFRIDVSNVSIGKSKEKGTGLGLILCKEFVERNGGTISAVSEVDRGSSFSFTVPFYNTK